MTEPPQKKRKGASGAAFPAMKTNDKATRLLSALRRENTHEVTPIWSHRQAGRYLPEYREYTKGYDFFYNCQHAERAAVITVQPERLDIDAAILFSDILIVPQALGMEVKMDPGKGPQFPAPMTTCGDISSVWDPLVKRFGAEKMEATCELNHKPDLQVARELAKSLAYTGDALQLVREKLNGNIPLYGFTGAPWTLMCYMTAGSSKPSYAEARKWFYQSPVMARKLLQLITNVCLELLLLEVANGAQMIQLFESHGGEITPEAFKEFELPCLDYIARTIKAQHPEVPVMLFARNASHSLEACFASSFDGVSIDCNTSISYAAGLAKKYNKALQGNLDPCIMFAPDDVLKAAVNKMLEDVAEVLGTNEHGVPNNYVANLGWGMMPSHQPEKLQCYIDAVHAFNKKK